MAFNIAALHAASDNLALTVRTIEAAAVTLEADRAALVVRVQAWGDADWEAGPLAALGVQYAEIAALRNKIKATAKSLCDQALPAVGLSLSDWYGAGRTLGQRLPPEFGQLVRANAGQIDPRYVWPPVNTDMGEVLKPGAPTNITLETAPIDTKQYAGGIIKAVVKTATIDTGGGGKAVVLTILGTQYNGDAWSGTVSIAEGALVASEHIVTPGTTNSFCTQITSIVVTCAGTWAAGNLDIFTDDDRAPAA